MKINLEVRGQSLFIHKRTVVSDTKNFLSFKIDFSDDWEGLNKKLFLTQNKTNEPYCFKITENVVGAKQGVNLTNGTWHVWIVGTSNDETIRAITETKLLLVDKAYTTSDGLSYPYIGDTVLDDYAKLKDIEDVIKYSKQTLTEEQKKQVRENIGVGKEVVEEMTIDILIQMGIAPVILDLDGAILTDKDDAILLNV